MQWKLILPNGREMRFYLRSVAEMYQQLHGGRLQGPAQLRLVA
jgi:hypothetical protein